jgi:hypothetical protein
VHLFDLDGTERKPLRQFLVRMNRAS